MMTVRNALDDIEAMESILSRIKVKEDNPSYYEIWYSDVSRLREIFKDYKNMLCNLEIKED